MRTVSPVARRAAGRAFTLIELIVVIVILAILAALAIPTFSHIETNAQDSSAGMTLAAVGREAVALAAQTRADGTVTVADVQSALADMPPAAAGPGLAAAGAPFSVVADPSPSTAYGVISAKATADGTGVGLTMLSKADHCVAVLAYPSQVQHWVLSATAACTGGNATTGPGGTTVAAPTPSQYQQTVAATSPVGFWPLNDPSGTTALDTSGAGNNGVYTGPGISYGQPGPISGSSAVMLNNSYVALPVAVIQPTNAGTSTMTVWFNTTGSGVLLGTQQNDEPGGAPPGAAQAVLYVGTDGLLHGTEVQNGQANTPASSVTVDDGRWHMATLVETPSQSTLYLDGSAVGSEVGSPWMGSNALQVGSGWGTAWPALASGWDYLTGSVANVSISSAALSAAQVAQQYAAGQ